MVEEICWLGYDGPESYTIDDENAPDPVQKQVLACYDPGIADLIGLFLQEYEDFHFHSEEEMAAFEASKLKQAEQFCRQGFRQGWNREEPLSADNLRVIFPAVWHNTDFPELDAPDEVWDCHRRMFRSQDAEEVLFWSFRFSAWGSFNVPLPYTLFRAITEGRFRRLALSYPEELLWCFLPDLELPEDGPGEEGPEP